MEPTLTLEMMKTDKQFGSDPLLAEEVKKAEQALRCVKNMIESGNVSELYTEDEVIEIITEIAIGCPDCQLTSKDGFLEKYCSMPNCNADYDGKKCWLKWLKFRKEKHE